MIKRYFCFLLMALFSISFSVTSVAAETPYQEPIKNERIMYTQDDLKLLACTIEAEAGDQSFVGMVAVGNVILNRVSSKQYQDSIKDVIYAPYQFAVVRNGSLSRKFKTYNKTEVSKMCISAARAAFDGENYVGDRLYFRMYTKSFAKTVKNYIIIGDHIFH